METIVYATRLKDTKKLYKSSSGGMFVALSDIFLKNGYAIVCSIYDPTTKKMEFKIVNSAVDRDKAIGSKYIQSSAGNVFKDSVKWLKENPDKKLLYIGMGCQAEAFRNYIEYFKLSDRVYIVDIVCHGTPSQKLWKEYSEYIEKKHGGEIVNVTFKDKRRGWSKPTALVEINGNEIAIKEYVNIFYNRCALRPSCYVCPYAKIERNTDITIGDYWGIEDVHPEFYDKMGNSLVLLHTAKGIKLFEKIKDVLMFEKSSVDKCLQPNLVHPTSVSEKRKDFWEDYEKKGIKYITKKYGNVSILKKIENKVLKYLKKI